MPSLSAERAVARPRGFALVTALIIAAVVLGGSALVLRQAAATSKETQRKANLARVVSALASGERLAHAEAFSQPAQKLEWFQGPTRVTVDVQPGSAPNLRRVAVTAVQGPMRRESTLLLQQRDGVAHACVGTCPAAAEGMEGDVGPWDAALAGRLDARLAGAGCKAPAAAPVSLLAQACAAQALVDQALPAGTLPPPTSEESLDGRVLTRLRLQGDVTVLHALPVFHGVLWLDGPGKLLVGPKGRLMVDGALLVGNGAAVVVDPAGSLSLHANAAATRNALEDLAPGHVDVVTP